MAKKFNPVKSAKGGAKQFNRVKIIIDGKSVLAQSGQTILDVAKKNKIDIPALCYHSDLKVKANCRICVVEIKGVQGLQTACSTKVKAGMEIITNSATVKRARKINLELIFAQHEEDCSDCIWNFNCQLAKLADEYKVKTTRFTERKNKRPIYQFGPSLIFDTRKCIDCRNCVEMCQQQGIDFLEVKKRGHHIEIVPSQDKNKDCIYCGQCLVHCPVGAIEAVGEFKNVERPLHQKDKIVIAQFAPAIRTSIGEEFDIPLGTPITQKLTAGMKQLGFDKVFDVSVGADFTTMEEAKELVDRIKGKKKLPMFTSCCPAWVKFVEFYEPKLIGHLTTARSPHIILGGLIKTYWAEKMKVNPKKIVVVSIMPCVAKKYEITRPELKINGLKPVDYVLTTRELAYLLIKHRIDLKKIAPERLDDPLGIPSGAGVIYGASGGVMESALRTAYTQLTGRNLTKLNLIKMRGMEGIKKAQIKIKNRIIKVATVNGINNAKLILEELKRNPHQYDYVEVMACPGGCIGGGGQPVPTDSVIRRKRAMGLYQIDRRKKIRLAHENPIVKLIYREYFTQRSKIHHICHTKYLPKEREGYKILKSKKTY